MQIKAWIISSKKRSILYPVIIFWNIMFHISQFILLEAIKWFDAFDKKPNSRLSSLARVTSQYEYKIKWERDEQHYLWFW